MEQILIFRCGNKDFGMPIKMLYEVRRYSEIISIPHAFDFIQGITNVRGRPLVMINLNKRLGFDSLIDNKEKRVLIVKIKDVFLGLIVDVVDEVEEFAKEKIKSISDLALPLDGKYIKLVVDLNGKMIMLLDLDELFSLEEINHISSLKGD